MVYGKNRDGEDGNSDSYYWMYFTQDRLPRALYTCRIKNRTDNSLTMINGKPCAELFGANILWMDSVTVFQIETYGGFDSLSGLTCLILNGVEP